MNNKPISHNAWLDPFSDTAFVAASLQIERQQLTAGSQRLIGEPLVAQRLLTQGQAELIQSNQSNLQGNSLAEWGSSFASIIATFLQPANTNNRKELRKYQDQFLTSQSNWPDLASMRDAAFLICADHKDPDFGLPHQLYKHHTPESLAEWVNFSPLLEQLIHTVSPIESPIWLAEASWVRESLTSIIFEAFKNTHDHARDEVSGADVETSLRSIYARFYSMEKVIRNIASINSDSHTPADQYVLGFVPKVARPGQRAVQHTPVSGFLEISILDSGPGMAARWLRSEVENVDKKIQLDAVLKCFQKGRSSTHSDGRGYGLWKVLLSLEKLRGFISVRTNNIHGFRQFGYGIELGRQELDGGQILPKETLFDWKRSVTTAQSIYPHVKGTVVSFILPMGGV